MKESVGSICLATLLAGAGVVIAQDSAAPAKSWESDVALGFNMTDGDKDSMLGNAALGSKYAKESNEIRLSAQGTYGESDVELEDGTTKTDKTAQNAGASAKYIRSFTRPYLFGVSRIDYDKIAKVDYRVFAGPGAGYYLVKNDRTQLAVEAGAGYLWEKVDGVKDDYPQLSFAQRYEQKIGAGAKLWESVEFLPKVDDFEDYLLNSEIGIESAMSARMSLRLVAQDKYDSTPGAGLEYNNLTITSALVLKL